MIRLMSLALCAAFLLAPAQAAARETIKIVGSSTVYPFTKAVAERVRTEGIGVDLKSTGTRAGFTGFCLGTSSWWPDLTNASRPISAGERTTCARAGVEAITELRVGFDGIVLARSNETATAEMSRRDLFLALAARVPRDGALVANPYTDWSEINPDLPPGPIAVYGPPVSSGTRQSFQDLALSAGCKAAQAEGPALVLDEIEDLDYCITLRGAPYFLEAGEDDTEIVHLLEEHPKAYGIFGFSFAFNNPETIHPNAIDGVLPTRETIADHSYPLSRPLFLYVKDNRVREMASLRGFLKAYISEEALGPDGYLAERGLVPLTQEAFAETKARLDALLQSAVTN